MNKYLAFLIIFFYSNFCFAETVVDECVESLTNIKAPIINSHYNYETMDKVSVPIKIINSISSELDVYEGQIINFKIAKDVYYNNKILFKRGTPIFAKVSLIITSGMNGIPASIIFDEIHVDVTLAGSFKSFEIFGQDRSLIVYPLKWLLTVLPPTGSLTNLIKGGHVKIKPKKVFNIIYYIK